VLRIGARHVGSRPVSFGDIPDDERPASGEAQDMTDAWPGSAFEQAVSRAVMQGLGLKDISRMAANLAINAALKEYGTIHEAARRLGVTDRALQLRRAGDVSSGQLPASKLGRAFDSEKKSVSLSSRSANPARSIVRRIISCIYCALSCEGLRACLTEALIDCV
jgi:hypothetical protein